MDLHEHSNWTSLTLKDNQHLRYNPLRGDWVLVCPHRMKRPWVGQVEKPEEQQIPRRDPKNPLCPGNTRPNGNVNPNYESTFMFTNDFPALLEEGPSPEDSKDPLFKYAEAKGTCKVMCFHPWSDITLPLMSGNEIRAVADKWVEIFENHGSVMGCSNPHPHCQVWASSFLPNEPTLKQRTQKEYYDKHKSPMLLDYAMRELKKKDRVVLDNEDWVWLVPYWAQWPYETILLPKTHVLRIKDLTDAQRNCGRKVTEVASCPLQGEFFQYTLTTDLFIDLLISMSHSKNP